MKIKSSYLKPKTGHMMLVGSVIDSELNITQDGEYSFREGSEIEAGYWRVLRIPGTNVRYYKCIFLIFSRRFTT
jgi:hypothetical protein